MRGGQEGKQPTLYKAVPPHQSKRAWSSQQQSSGWCLCGKKEGGRNERHSQHEQMTTNDHRQVLVCELDTRSQSGTAAVQQGEERIKKKLLQKQNQGHVGHFPSLLSLWMCVCERECVSGCLAVCVNVVSFVVTLVQMSHLYPRCEGESERKISSLALATTTLTTTVR